MNSTGNFNPQKQMQRIFISFLEANRREAERRESKYRHLMDTQF